MSKISNQGYNGKRVKQAVGKVVFTSPIFNGKNYIWIRISRSYVDTLARYWRNKTGFYYMKIYVFDRVSRDVGQQIGFITKNVATLDISPSLLWSRGKDNEGNWNYR